MNMKRIELEDIFDQKDRKGFKLYNLEINKLFSLNIKKREKGVSYLLSWVNYSHYLSFAGLNDEIRTHTEWILMVWDIGTAPINVF